MNVAKTLRRRLLVAGALSAVAASALAPSAMAQPWNESNDAGSLPASAQKPAAGAAFALDKITGSLATANDRDMYKVCLNGSRTFSARTDITAGTLNDTQLFLFKSDGRGVYADDDSGAGLKSCLPTGGLSPQNAGPYYLAISSFNDDARNGFGLLVPAANVFTQAPTGPGGGAPITSWNGLGGGTGTYTITLTGARFCPFNS